MTPLKIAILHHYCQTARPFTPRSEYVERAEAGFVHYGWLTPTVTSDAPYRPTAKAIEWHERVMVAAGKIAHRVHARHKRASKEGVHGMDSIRLHFIVRGKSPIQEAREAMDSIRARDAMGDEIKSFGDVMARLVAASRADLRDGKDSNHEERMGKIVKETLGRPPTFDEAYTLFSQLGDKLVTAEVMSRAKWKHVFDIVFARTVKLSNEPLCKAIYNALYRCKSFDEARKIALETLP